MPISPPSLHPQRCYVIAEIGNNHEGSFDTARRLVDAAASTGVDAVKFQTYRTELFISPRHAERFARMKRFELSYEQFRMLSEQAHALGLDFISTPLDLESAGFLAGICDTLKIASGDITFLPLLEKVAASGLPVILSTGASLPVEIDRAVATLKARWLSDGVDPGLAVLHCVSAYPVPAAEANIAAVATLAARYPACTAGYSDHVMGIEAPILALAAGARVIEKHFTLANDFSDFRDHQLSAEPAAMRLMVERLRAAEAMLGTGEKVVQPSESALRPEIRRSIATVRPISEGHLLVPQDVAWLRPADGLAPGREGEVLGHRAAHDIGQGVSLQAMDFSRQ